MSKLKLKPATLRAYCRRKIFCAGRFKTKLADLVCEGLAKDGYPKPDDVGARAWINQHADIILNGKLGNLRPQLPKKPKKEKLIKSKEASNEFLFSYEWRKLRMEALKKYGARCQCCGATPATGAVMNVDHIKPRKVFPELALTLTNLQILCHECNHGKGNWDMTDWRNVNDITKNSTSAA